MLKNMLSLVLLISLAFYSCERNDLNRPADVSLRLAMTDNEVLNGSLILTETKVKISEFRFTGQRNLAEDIDFKRSYGSFLELDLLNAQSGEIFFNVPIGLYELFDIRVDIAQGTGDFARFDEEFETWLQNMEDEREDDGDDDDGDDDGDDGGDDDGDEDTTDDSDDDDIEELRMDLGVLIQNYLASTQPGLSVKAQYSFQGQEYEVIFSLEDFTSFLSPVLNNERNRQLSFSEGTQNIIQLHFDPAYWFSPLSLQILSNAEYGISGSLRLVPVNKRINTEIYTILLSRFENSFEGLKLED